jgi:hypothetical protein
MSFYRGKTAVPHSARFWACHCAVAILALALIHFQRPQLTVYLITIPDTKTVADSPLMIQNTGNGLLGIGNQDGSGFPHGPNSLFLEPKQCALIWAIHEFYILLPCRTRPPQIRGWIERGARISLDGANWMQAF